MENRKRSRIWYFWCSLVDVDERGGEQTMLHHKCIAGKWGTWSHTRRTRMCESRQKLLHELNLVVSFVCQFFRELQSQWNRYTIIGFWKKNFFLWAIYKKRLPQIKSYSFRSCCRIYKTIYFNKNIQLKTAKKSMFAIK